MNTIVKYIYLRNLKILSSSNIGCNFISNIMTEKIIRISNLQGANNVITFFVFEQGLYNYNHIIKQFFMWYRK